MFGKFKGHINKALRHQNLQLRKEIEKVFRTLYLEFGAQLEPILIDQKSLLK